MQAAAKRKREVEPIAAAQQVKADEVVSVQAVVVASRQEPAVVARCRQQDAFRLRCKTVEHHRERIAYRSDNISSATRVTRLLKMKTEKGKNYL